MGELPDDHRLLNARAHAAPPAVSRWSRQMLALALGLLIVAGALAVYAANRAVYQHQGSLGAAAGERGWPSADGPRRPPGRLHGLPVAARSPTC